MEHRKRKESKTGCVILHTICLRIHTRTRCVYVSLRVCDTHSEIEQSLPRCCTRFFKRVLFIQSTTTITTIYIYVCVYVRIYGLFPPETRGRFSSKLACKIETGKESGGREKERERKKRDTYNLVRGTSSGRHPPSRTCHAAIFIDENCQRQRNVPPPASPRERSARAFASVMGNCLDETEKKRKKKITFKRLSR